MLGAAVGVIAILLVASGKLSVGVLIVLFIALAVAWMLRKIVFRILGAAVIVYGVYIMLDVLLGNDHNVGPRPRRPLLFQPVTMCEASRQSVAPGPVAAALGDGWCSGDFSPTPQD